MKVCAPVHDALLIEAPKEDLDNAIFHTQRAMEEAGEYVLGGFKLRSDVKAIIHPDRYADERGVDMWELVWEIINQLDGAGEQVGVRPSTPGLSNPSGNNI